MDSDRVDLHRFAARLRRTGIVSYYCTDLACRRWRIGSANTAGAFRCVLGLKNNKNLQNVVW